MLRFTQLITKRLTIKKPSYVFKLLYLKKIKIKHFYIIYKNKTFLYILYNVRYGNE